MRFQEIFHSEKTAASIQKTAPAFFQCGAAAVNYYKSILADKNEVVNIEVLDDFFIV